MGLFQDYLRGAAMAKNPQLLKRRIDSMDNQARTEFLGQVMGQAARPAQYEQQVQAMSGPLPQGEQFRPNINVNQQVSEAQKGSGWLGGSLTDRELAAKLLSAPTQDTRQVGGSLIQQMLKPGTKNGSVNFQQYQQFNPQQRAAFDQFKGRSDAAPLSQYSNIRYDKATGKSFGLNRQNQYVQIPGASGTAESQGAGGLSRKDMLSASNTLRDDFDARTKDFRQMDRSWNNIRKAEETGIGDVSMIFNIMKLFDPNSTVREGEAATAKNAAGVPAMIQNLWNDVIKGRALSAPARQQILSQAERYYDNSASSYDRTVDQYTNMAERSNLEPLDIVTPRHIAIEQRGPAEGPSKKEVEKSLGRKETVAEEIERLKHELGVYN